MRILLVFVVVAAVGCGQGSNPGASGQPVLDPKAQPPISETATKAPADPAEIKRMLDLEEYPGAQVVDNTKLSSPSMSPDEARYELSRKSSDAPGKVISFFESKLGEKGSKQGSGTEVFGRTKRGNFVRVHIEPDGAGSKFTLNVISYAKDTPAG